MPWARSSRASRQRSEETSSFGESTRNRREPGQRPGQQQTPSPTAAIITTWGRRGNGSASWTYCKTCGTTLTKVYCAGQPGAVAPPPHASPLQGETTEPQTSGTPQVRAAYLVKAETAQSLRAERATQCQQQKEVSDLDKMVIHFGKHKAKNYFAVRTAYPGYAAWAVQTVGEEIETDHRLEHFAKYFYTCITLAEITEKRRKSPMPPPSAYLDLLRLKASLVKPPLRFNIGTNSSVTERSSSSQGTPSFIVFPGHPVQIPTFPDGSTPTLNSDGFEDFTTPRTNPQAYGPARSPSPNRRRVRDTETEEMAVALVPELFSRGLEDMSQVQIQAMIENLQQWNTDRRELQR